MECAFVQSDVKKKKNWVDVKTTASEDTAALERAYCGRNAHLGYSADFETAEIAPSCVDLRVVVVSESIADCKSFRLLTSSTTHPLSSLGDGPARRRHPSCCSLFPGVERHDACLPADPLALGQDSRHL